MAEEVEQPKFRPSFLVLPDTGRRRVWVIELGIVTVIVAILLSILVPVYRSSRGAAKGVVCMATLQKLGRMMAMYVQDYDGVYPPLAPGRSLEHATRPFTRPEFAWTVRMAAYLDPAARGGKLADREVKDEDPADAEKENPFVCPAADVPTYAYNAALGARVFPRYEATSGPVSDAGVSVPSDTYLFFDTSNQADGANSLSGYRYYAGAPREGEYRVGDLVLPSAAIRVGWIRPRHAGGANVLYCDGHARRLTDPNIRLAKRNPFDPAAQPGAP